MVFELRLQFHYNRLKGDAEFRLVVRTEMYFITVTIELIRRGSLTSLTPELIFIIPLWV
jgi:hypothetical protein